MTETSFEYIPSDDFFHRLDPRTKLVFFLAVIVLMLLISDPIWLVMMLTSLLLICHFSHVSVGEITSMIGSLWFVFVPLVVITALTTSVGMGGVPVEEQHILFWLMKTSTLNLPVSIEGLLLGVQGCLKLACMLTAIRTVLMVTPLKDLILGMTKLKLPTEFGIAISLGFGYVPVLIDENRKIKEALMARGWEYRYRNPIKKFVSLMNQMFLPSLFGAFRRSTQMAIALETRGFSYDISARTYMKEIRMGVRDYITVSIIATIIVLFTLMKLLLPNYVNWSFTLSLIMNYFKLIKP